MFSSVGIAASGGVIAALIVGVSILSTILVQCFGGKWRKKAVETRSSVLELNVVVRDLQVSRV